MKILIDARLFGPENTGNGRYTMNLVEGLARLDHENRFVILLRKKYYESLKLPNNWEKVLADFKHYSFIEQVKLPFLINKYKPDLVHFPHFIVPLLYFGKYVVTIHDIIMHKFKGGAATTRHFPAYQVTRMGYHLIFSRAVAGSRQIIVPSKAVRKEVIDYYKIKPSKVRVVYEGFDSKITITSKNKFPNPYFVYVGNAYPHKNLVNLIKAIVILNKQSDQKVSLLISSARNIFTQRIEEMIKKNNAGSFVKLLGFVPDSELGTLYKNSVAFASASLSEGFGLPGLEAISSGTLLLVSDIPVYREVYEDNAIYFDPNDPTSIAKAMEKSLKLVHKRRLQIIQESQKFAKKYSWLKMAKQTLDIYEKMTSVG